MKKNSEKRAVSQCGGCAREDEDTACAFRVTVCKRKVRRPCEDFVRAK